MGFFKFLLLQFINYSAEFVVAIFLLISAFISSFPSSYFSSDYFVLVLTS